MSLDQTTAQFRASVIQKNSITYNYHISLETNSYRGLAEVNFTLNNVNLTELKIDFTGKITAPIVLNANKIIAEHTQNFIILPKTYLQKGRNRLSVSYLNYYDKDRSGCITFSDNEEQFVYTDFPPYSAHRVFPCFDQPDLKAKMKLTAVTPYWWTAISNQPVAYSSVKVTKGQYKQMGGFSERSVEQHVEQFIKAVSPEHKVTTFEETQFLPTYVYVLAAGPWGYFEAPQGSTKVPMKLYCIPSSLALLDAYNEFIFDVTAKSMTFYQSYFSELFPFKKYDQIFVRDFAHWAMENAGLVAYNQKKLLLKYSTEDDYHQFAVTLAHELSHHWFGNFVTMEWWDDLWLNQSFADYISHYCLENINASLFHQLQPSSIYFRDRKSWGYQDDERTSATHPIRGAVLDTDVANSMFDGITYAKGGAVLKQLMYLTGQVGFSKGLQKYFDRFKWSNATIYDFLEDMKNYFPSGINLEEWTESWLETSSLNVFQSVWDPTNKSSSASIQLYQKDYTEKYNTLRWHKLEVALFDASGSIIQTKPVLVSPKVNPTVIQYDGAEQITAIFVNSGDYSFFQNYIDPASLFFFMNNIGLITDDSIRCIIWFNISQMVKQTLIRLEPYVSFIEEKLFIETQTIVVSQLLADLYGFMTNYLNEDEKVVQSTIIFDKIYTQLKDESIQNTDLLQILYTNFIRYAQTDVQKLKLKNWLEGTDPTLEIRKILSETTYWEIVKKIYSISDDTLSKQEKQAVFDIVKEKYPASELKDATELICKTILIKDQTQLEQIYQRFRTNDDSLTTRTYLSEGWRNQYHREEVDNFSQRYFTDIIELCTTLSFSYFQLFYQNLRPYSTDQEGQLEKYLQVLDQLTLQKGMEAHVKNINKIVDDISTNLINRAYNVDTDSTLTQDRTIQRFDYVVPDSLSYIAHIGYLPIGQTNIFTGLAQLTFELSALPKLLPVDFICQQVHELIINGVKAIPTLSGQFLVIPRVYLKIGVNVITVRYSSVFSNDGYGVMSYVDKSVSPNEEYTYTHFEPYYCHRLFPCFDQPDLKSTLELNVIVPEEWIVVGNEAVSYKSNTFDQANYISKASAMIQGSVLENYLENKAGGFYILGRTKKLPSYLFCLVAGQYYNVELPAEQRYSDIPMQIYCLSSYSQALNTNSSFIFEIVRLAVQFYQSKFKVPYQFNKYDIAFCHQFTPGAMENPGIITFNDTYLYTETVSVEKMVRLAITLAHECAHNWFGDYVTMKWWNDLWLNQSFADYMAYFCLDSIKDKVTTIPTYTTGWLGGLNRAVGGFRQDQMSTTHPVRSYMPNTSLARMYFDSITYRKGMMTLKQLIFLMGEQKFFKGVTDYFNAFGWSNGTIDDFIGAIKPYYSSPDENYTIEKWKQDWILTPSLNILSIDWDPSSTSTTSTLSINQTYFKEDYPLLRYHKLNLALFREDNTYTIQQVFVKNQSSTPISYDASAGVKAILINESFQGFVKYTIDSTSLTYFQTNISKIRSADDSESALNRMVIWFYMNEMVRDGKLKVEQHRDVVLNTIADETEDGVYQFAIEFVNQSTGSYIPIDMRESMRGEVFQFVMSQLQSFNKTISKKKNKFSFKKSKNSNRVLTLDDQENRIKMLKDYLPVYCSTPTQVNALEFWRNDAYEPLVNYPITQSQAWLVVRLIFTSPNYTSDARFQIFDDQQAKTPGIAAVLNKHTVVSLDAVGTDELDPIYQLFTTMTESVNVKGYYAKGWNNIVHLSELKNIYKTRLVSDIPIMSKTLSLNHFRFFYTNLAPIDDDLDETISLYESISLPGSAMLGHMNNIKKILDDFKLRRNLYIFNS